MTDDQLNYIIHWLESMQQFSKLFIPEPPVLDKELYDKYVIPNFIRCGAIPKDKLIPGKVYFGSCRNTDKAWWLGGSLKVRQDGWGNPAAHH